MSRKTPSNPDPDTGKTGGIRQYFRQIGAFARRSVERYPFHFLAGMLVCIIGSGILAFTVMRVNTPHALPAFPKPPASGIGNGITDMMGTYGALQEVTALQDTIAAIIGKDSLDATDSIRLTDALKRFELIQQSIYHKNSNP